MSNPNILIFIGYMLSIISSIIFICWWIWYFVTVPKKTVSCLEVLCLILRDIEKRINNIERMLGSHQINISSQKSNITSKKQYQKIPKL